MCYPSDTYNKKKFSSVGALSYRSLTYEAINFKVYFYQCFIPFPGYAGLPEQALELEEVE